MKAIALIPARLAASRFPRKLLALIQGETVIARTYLAVKETNLFEEVIVVCDHAELEEAVQAVGGKTLRSKGIHESGTDRIAEAATDLDADLIVNVQGDEPFIHKQALSDLICAFEDEMVQVASLKHQLEMKEGLNNPNVVKVITDLRGNALYFSRAPVPVNFHTSNPAKHYEHVGVYAFRKRALIAFTQLAPTPLEQAEKIECLRFLENGIGIRMVEVTEYVGIKIDTPEDLQKANEYLSC